MIQRNWKWPLDQWLENKVLSKVPKNQQSPHFFFLLGMMTAIAVLILFKFLF